MPTRFTLAALSLLIVSVICSCGASGSHSERSKNNGISVANHAIPAEFGTENTTLVCILKGRNSRDRYMKKHIKKLYKGNYEFVLEDDLGLQKYADKGIYRYVFDFDRSVVDGGKYYNTIMRRYETRQLPVSRYFIWDRKTGEYYYCPFASGGFGATIKKYVKNLEEVRAQNK